MAQFNPCPPDAYYDRMDDFYRDMKRQVDRQNALNVLGVAVMDGGIMPQRVAANPHQARQEQQEQQEPNLLLLLED